MDHQDAAAWAQHGQVLAGADDELGDADAAGAGESFDQEGVGALGDRSVRADEVTPVVQQRSG
ncbi:hypothetical protein OG905_02185 [Streptomyces sp. NBC_00322]|nr:hypothetical protein [Streptomyces sp. NBC_00322]